MKTNLLNLIYNADTITSTDDKKRSLKFTINALTAATCSAMMSHCFAAKRGEFGGVDERNEHDAAQRGTELKTASMLDNGYDVDISAYKVAQITDGIRHELYDELHRYGDFPHEDALFKTPVTDITSAINWDAPMSTQMYMDTRTRNAGIVNPDEIAAICKRRTNVTEATVTTILKDEAVRQQKRMADISPDVMTEIGSLTDVYDVDAFTSLPTVVQVRVAEHIARALNREFGRLLPRSLRDLDASGECDLIEAQLKTVRAFINESEQAERMDSQRIAA